MNKIQSLFAILLLGCVFSSAPMADLATWGPGTFRLVGIVDSVNKNTIFIDDQEYRLSPTAKMKSAGNKNTPLDRIKPGQMLGFNTITINGRILIDQIWIIPKKEQVRYRPML